MRIRANVQDMHIGPYKDYKFGEFARTGGRRKLQTLFDIHTYTHINSESSKNKYPTHSMLNSLFIFVVFFSIQ